MRYPIVVESADDFHAFGVVVPDLPGCFSAGDTLEEAFENAKEAIVGWLECEIDEGLWRGRHIPYGFFRDGASVRGVCQKQRRIGTIRCRLSRVT